ncbi:MAG: Lrp/AsnC family transcriptional regulator [candidate division NC10 bacterium]|nr:Lrp/AsnC family transcriptional regulator [candidate division NC10 bacterium]
MPTHAYVLIEASSDKAKTALKAIIKIPGVKMANAVTGPYDIIAFVEASDVDALGRVVLSKIRTISGVTKTLTCVAIDVR